MWVGGVRGIILDEFGRLLMVKQTHEENDIWMVPGGAIEEGETSEQALIREILEETGLIIEVNDLIWHVEEVSKRGMRFVNFFNGKVKEGKLKLGSDPEFTENKQVLKEAKFVSKEEIKQFKKVYPLYLRDELWEILEKEAKVNPYKIRED